jgi:hypothetical protein
MPKRVRGIEPLSLAWKAKVLPLNYTRIENFPGKSQDSITVRCRTPLPSNWIAIISMKALLKPFKLSEL